MLKKNKNFIKFILCSLAITGALYSNANAIFTENTETKFNLMAINSMESGDEIREKLQKEYNENKLFKDFIDAVMKHEKTLSTKGHEEQMAIVLDINQKMELAKNSGTLSKEALEVIDESIQDLEPTYSKILKEAKNKEMKPAPLPEKSKDDIKPVPKEKQEKAKQKIEKHLPKTGYILDNNLLLQIGGVSSILGIYLLKKKK